jgi:hypothetical protein
MAQTLVQRVAAKLGVDINTSSTPSQTQVLQWLNEGLEQIKRLLPPEYFPNSMTSSSIATTAGNVMTVPSDYVKLIMATCISGSTNYPVKFVNPVEYLDITTGRNSYRSPSESYPVGSMYNGSFRFAADTSNTAKKWELFYIKESAAITSSNQSVSENPVIDSLIVEYAALQYKYSDEELEAFNVKIQEYFAKVQDINQNIQLDFTSINKRRSRRES